MNASPPDSARRSPVPLSMVESGRNVRLITVQAGRGLAQRLAEIGFVPGVEVHVVSNNSVGPMVVVVKGTRLVLGRGMANKILVE